MPNRTVFITGAAAGIGRATALTFAKNGLRPSAATSMTFGLNALSYSLAMQLLFREKLVSAANAD
jgi:NADP-dependent 3-hydroxy acid dehydrogenase YdfG